MIRWMGEISVKHRARHLAAIRYRTIMRVNVRNDRHWEGRQHAADGV